MSEEEREREKHGFFMWKLDEEMLKTMMVWKVEIEGGNA